MLRQSFPGFRISSALLWHRLSQNRLDRLGHRFGLRGGDVDRSPRLLLCGLTHAFLETFCDVGPNLFDALIFTGCRRTSRAVIWCWTLSGWPGRSGSCLPETVQKVCNDQFMSQLGCHIMSIVTSLPCDTI